MTGPGESTPYHAAELARLVGLVADTPDPWTVEMGTVRWEGGPDGPVERDYVLVEIREHWHLLAAPGEEATPVRTARATPDDDSRLILGPGAVLQLLDRLLWSDTPAGEVLDPSLDVFHTRNSPYPPRTLPPWLHTAGIQERHVVREGRWAPAENDLFREIWPRQPSAYGGPVGALSHWEEGGLRVECSRRAAQTVGVMVESMVPLDWRNRGPGSWAARLAITDSGGRLSVPGNARLQFDTRALLAGLEGALGPAEPALLVDPVQYGRHGWAPALATTWTLGDCRVAT